LPSFYPEAEGNSNECSDGNNQGSPSWASHPSVRPPWLILCPEEQGWWVSQGEMATVGCMVSAGEALCSSLFFSFPCFFFSWKLLLLRWPPSQQEQSHPACRGTAGTGHIPGVAPPLWSEIKVGQETRFGRAEDWTVTSLAIGMGTKSCQRQPARGTGSCWDARQSGQPLPARSHGTVCSPTAAPASSRG